MSKEEKANRAVEKKSVHYKNIIRGLSCVTNREDIAISAILVKGDYEALFLINIIIGRKKGRLIVSVLLDTRC